MLPAPDALQDASAVWRALARQAGLDVKRYDWPLVRELAQRLGVSPARFPRDLRRTGVPVERLIGERAGDLLHGAVPFGVEPQPKQVSDVDRNAHLADYDGKTVLFAGDAHADVLLGSLARPEEGAGRSGTAPRGPPSGAAWRTSGGIWTGGP